VAGVGVIASAKLPGPSAPTSPKRANLLGYLDRQPAGRYSYWEERGAMSADR